MNFLFANTTNHRRIITFVATMLFDVFTSLVFYKMTLTFRNVLFPPIVGLLVFEFLFRTRKWLSLKTFPLYVIIIVLSSPIIYSILYGMSYGRVGNPLDSLMNSLIYFPYNLYFLIDASVVTGIAYYLIKIYRNESGLILQEESTPDEPVAVAGWQGIIFGMIGAIIGAVPVTILKYTIIFSDFDWLCTPIGNFSNNFELSTCGLVGGPSWAYLFFILFGGALFGYLGKHISIRNGKYVSFVAGILFDLLFVFVIFPIGTT